MAQTKNKKIKQTLKCQEKKKLSIQSKLILWFMFLLICRHCTF